MKTNLPQNGLIAAERQRRIYNILSRYGSVKVVDLAKELSVGINTIRNDLDCLQREGKLARVHGGAILRDPSTPRPPYNETRNQNMQEKAWIAKAAQDYLPQQGSVFIGDGTTTYQFASLIKPERKLHVITNALEIAAYLSSNNIATVDFAGGSIRSDSLASDWSLSEEALDRLFWDVTFIGAAAIDIARGITTLDRTAAQWEKKVIEHGGQVVVLCDSSKLAKFSYCKVGDISLIDVLITDKNASSSFVRELRENGIRVVLASSDGYEG